MKQFIEASNKYYTQIANGSGINSSAKSGSFVVQEITTEGYTLPGGPSGDLEAQKVMFWLVLNYGTSKEEIFRIYRVDLTNKTLYFDLRLAYPAGPQSHEAGDSVQLNDMAEMVNAIGANVDNFGYTESVSGASPEAAKVYGGYPVYNGIGLTSTTVVADATFPIGATSSSTLTDNALNYIVFNFATGTFQVVQLAALATTNGALMASVNVSGGVVWAIVDYRKHSLGMALDTATFDWNAGAVIIKNLGVALTKLAQGGAATGNLLIWNGTSWVPWTAVDLTTWPATEMAVGTIQVATQADTDNGTDIGVTGSPNAVTPSKMRAHINNKHTATDSNFLLGETVVAGDNLFTTPRQVTDNYILDDFVLESVSVGDVLFPETVPTVISANQNISDVAANRRVSFPILGNGVAWATFGIRVWKVGSPTTLYVRIETDSAWVPSGTLVSTNAFQNISSSNIEATVSPLIVTLGETLTLTAGTKYHIVLWSGVFGNETISWGNYFLLGYSTNNTTTRGIRLFNASWWAADVNKFPIHEAIMPSWAATEDTLTTVPNNSGNLTPSYGARITVNRDFLLTEVKKITGTTATRALIRNSANAVVATSNFSWDIAAFSFHMKAWEIYSVEADSNGANYTYQQQVGTTYPVTWVNVTYTSRSQSWNSEIVTERINIRSITGSSLLSSTFFNDTVLSKANGSFPYKLPKDFIRIARNAVTSSWAIRAQISGIASGFTGLSTGSDYYLSNTSWGISRTLGTNQFPIGRAVSSTALLIPTRSTYETHFRKLIIIDSPQNFFGTVVRTYNHNLWYIPLAISFTYQGTPEMYYIDWVTWWVYAGAIQGWAEGALLYQNAHSDNIWTFRVSAVTANDIEITYTSNFNFSTQYIRAFFF